jgi:heme exporter protein A
VRTLSAGQRRRIALAGLSLLLVPLWLLDEPTTNLDAEGQQLVGTLIEEHLARGGLVLAATHHELPLPASRVQRLELAHG